MSETVTYTISKIGTKWLEGISPAGTSARIEKNSASRVFAVGETYTFSARVEETNSGHSRKVLVYPETAGEYIVVTRGEPSGAFGPVRCQFQTGQTLRNPEQKGQILSVVKTSSRFVSEDGMNLGIGDHEGWIHTANCRLASRSEIAEFFNWENENHTSHELKLNLIEAWQHLRDIIQEAGDRPLGVNGEVLKIVFKQLFRDTGFSSGKGEQFGIDDEDFMWHVRINGVRDQGSPNVQIGDQKGTGYRCLVKRVFESLSSYEIEILKLNLYNNL